MKSSTAKAAKTPASKPARAPKAPKTAWPVPVETGLFSYPQIGSHLSEADVARVDAMLQKGGVSRFHGTVDEAEELVAMGFLERHEGDGVTTYCLSSFGRWRFLFLSKHTSQAAKNAVRFNMNGVMVRGGCLVCTLPGGMFPPSVYDYRTTTGGLLRMVDSDGVTYIPGPGWFQVGPLCWYLPPTKPVPTPAEIKALVDLSSVQVLYAEQAHCNPAGDVVQACSSILGYRLTDGREAQFVMLPGQPYHPGDEWTFVGEGWWVKDLPPADGRC